MTIIDLLTEIAMFIRLIRENNLLKHLLQLLERVQGQENSTVNEDLLEPYLDKQQVMDYFRIRETTYYRWIQEGKLQPRGPGEDKFFKHDIRKLMERRKYRHRG